MNKLLIIMLIPTALCARPSNSFAQKAPEAGYVFPAGGKAGTTVEVHLGGYDWTPDMEFHMLNRRVQLAPTGPPGPILIPPPPYWFGAKGRIAALPLPREVSARLVLPADLPPGPIFWQAANANGATAAVAFVVGTGLEVVEDEKRTGPQTLPKLPVTVSGRLSKNEEVDQFRFTAPRTGPITLDLLARRLGAKFMGVLEVRDLKGAMIADLAGTNGNDPTLTFSAQKGMDYVVSISDVDFGGDRSFVYRLTVTDGPRILGTLPAVGQAGTTADVEFIGIGVASGTAKLESVHRKVAFPPLPAGQKVSAFAYRLETPFGTAAPFSFPLSDLREAVAFPRKDPRQVELALLPAGKPGAGSIGQAVTGVLDQPDAVDEYSCKWQKGQTWSLALEARRFGSPLDVCLAIIGPDGKELARNEDLPETTDAGLDFTVPADGTYRIVVSDQSGKSGTRAAIYRLSLQQPTSGFILRLASQRARVTLGDKFNLTVNAVRQGFQGPIHLSLQGLPAGVSTPSDLTIPAGKTDLTIPLLAATTAGTAASHITVTGSANELLQLKAKAPLPATKDLAQAPAKLHATRSRFFYPYPVGKARLLPAPREARSLKARLTEPPALAKGEGAPTITRIALAPITTNLAPRSPAENRLPALFLACTLKPLFKGHPVDQDTGRKVHRGSTFPAEVIIDRLDGFQGEIVLLMSATQSYQVHGITGGEVKVPPQVTRTVYPCFMPEWLETTRTSRMGMIGMARVVDPKGKARYLTGEIAGFITMTMEGALLKVAAEEPDMTVPAGQPFDVHLKISRATKLTDTARLELRLPAELAGKFKAGPVVVPAGQEKAVFRVTPLGNVSGTQSITIRATALQDGVYPAISETAITLEFLRKAP